MSSLTLKWEAEAKAKAAKAAKKKRKQLLKKLPPRNHDYSN